MMGREDVDLGRVSWQERLMALEPAPLRELLDRYGTRAELTITVLRFALLTTAASLIAFSGNFDRVAGAIAAVAVVDLIASIPHRFLRSPPAALLEACLVALIATAPEPVSGNLMLCFLAPALAAGLRGGYRWSLATTAGVMLVGVLQILRTASNYDSVGLIDLFRWSALSLALGWMASWYEKQTAESPQRPYAEAVRVLTELDAVTRRLPAGLDVGTLASRALEHVVSRCGTDRAVLVTMNSAGALEAVASYPNPGRQEVDQLGKWDAWAALAAEGAPIQRMTADGVLVMCPVQVSDRLIGYVLLHCERRLERDRINSLVEAVDDSAVPLEAALLFTGIRDIATNEERSRIAREIHDGIAQDVAFLGYAADEIVDVAEEGEVHDLALELRRQITRVVGELRMSVFTLREGVGPTDSLGGTLANHARRIFRDSPVQLHLAVDESPHRLRPDVQSEILRVGQEALTNSRRHADANNVWVTCTVDAPSATVLIEDDGKGLGGKGADSYGMEIMRERAARISAELEVSERPNGGTTVRIAI